MRERLGSRHGLRINSQITSVLQINLSLCGGHSLAFQEEFVRRESDELRDLGTAQGIISKGLVNRALGVVL